MVKIDKHPDFLLLGVLIALLFMGILILSSVSAAFSQEKFGNPYYFLKHQVLYGLIPGLILALFVFKINLNFLKKWAMILLIINLVLLGMVFLPKIGIKALGATRWLKIGPISFQPSELLKLTSILYFSAWLSSRTEKGSKKMEKKSFNENLIAFLVMVGIISAFLIFQPDISTLGTIVIVGISIYFLAGTPFWHSLLMILAGTGALYALVKFAPYRINRLLVFLNPETDPMGIGYQAKQALMAIGSGGISGVGLGMSQQKYGFLPQSISDSIFAIFAEETGFVGCIVLISLFLIFLWSGFKIAKEKQDKFSKLTALGITSWISLQAFIGIASMTGILPLMGVPLPFISYGGSALVSELVGVGILLNISKNVA
jgi:cell division protein FtsW